MNGSRRTLDGCAEIAKHGDVIRKAGIEVEG